MLLVLLGAAALILAHYSDRFWRIITGLDEFKREIRSWGVWGPLVFIGFQIVQIVIFFIPGEVTQIAGGAIFGPWMGAFYAWIGAVLGSALAFLLAGWLGRPLIKALVKPQTFERIESLLNARKGFVTVFILFVIPGTPKDTLCYVAGLTPIHFWTFVVISSFARIPGILLSTFLGHSVMEKRYVEFLALCAIGLVALVLGLVFQKRIHDWMSRKDSDESQATSGK
jgi:uncharacterized membrane protein YdjX (TVP38/TMEM64 family)